MRRPRKLSRCAGIVVTLSRAVAVALAACALGERRLRLVALAVALFVAGLWWGSVRLDALDHSELRSEIGRAGPALLEVTGPSRRSPFEVRVPVRVLRFGGETPGERARLDLPAGRAPPQGALLSAIVEIVEPRPEEDGFDEAGYLRRQGVHVILTASSFTVVGRRGGLGGIADRVRGAIARLAGPGCERGAARSHRRGRPRRGRGAQPRPSGPVPRLGPLPPARRFRPERRLRRSRDARARVAARGLAVDRGDRGARRRLRLPDGGRMAAVGCARRRRRRARLARLAGRQSPRPLVLPSGRRRGPPRLEPVLGPRAGVPAVVRRGRLDLSPRPPDRGSG